MRPAVLALLLCLSACAAEGRPGGDASDDACEIVQRPAPLPPQLEESSGVAASRRHPDLFWSHDDSGGDPVVYGVRSDGSLLEEVLVTGARNHDWEDIAVGPCPRGGDCLYIADTGDNQEKRRDAAIYRVPEPAPGQARTAAAQRFPVRFRDHPRDAEALFVLPSGELFLVSKGRSDAVAVYRYPGPLRPDTPVTLQRVAALSQGKVPVGLQVTGASVTPDGEWVGVRTYSTLNFFPARELAAGRARSHLEVDLTPLYEAQGEGVALLPGGRVVLTSERGNKRSPASISVLACVLGPGERVRA